MNSTISVSLAGQVRPFQLDAAGYDALQNYLSQARARLTHEHDRAEVLGDLERSIGDKLGALPDAHTRVITPGELGAILAQMGHVQGDARSPGALPPQKRWVRVRKGAQIGGVCLGLSAKTGVRVDWVRFGCLVVAGMGGGIPMIGYFALMLWLPQVETVEDIPLSPAM